MTIAGRLVWSQCKTCLRASSTNFPFLNFRKLDCWNHHSNCFFDLKQKRTVVPTSGSVREASPRECASAHLFSNARTADLSGCHVSACTLQVITQEHLRSTSHHLRRKKFTSVSMQGIMKLLRLVWCEMNFSHATARAMPVIRELC